MPLSLSTVSLNVPHAVVVFLLDQDARKGRLTCSKFLQTLKKLIFQIIVLTVRDIGLKRLWYARVL
jgi:hypothetical protein